MASTSERYHEARDWSAGSSRTPGQEDRGPDPPALELALVPHRRPRKGGDGDGSRSLRPRGHASARHAGLVVVFEDLSSRDW